MSAFDEGDGDSEKGEPTQAEVASLMEEMRRSMEGGEMQMGQTRGFKSEYNTKDTKYAGAHSVVSYEG